ncbi:tRNA (guanosine(37)-N1)-methyltransferase TrmD [Candidatus Woesebacteria bacterium]|nr:tRNA (guanosine(37)-N1)-methyltransferase TrmD [Candidatus Woesebacteria bacterium]
MFIDIFTLFPEMFDVPFGTSMMKKAKDIGAVEINVHNLRDWAEDKHKTVDGRPFGGGKGMVIRVDVLDLALQDLDSRIKNHDSRKILLSPQGPVFTQNKARKLSKLEHIILIAGHYEGFDERIRKHLIDEELSIGEYVLTGGEIPAMVVTDAVVRLLPGVLDPEATENESFSQSNEETNKQSYDYPTYTRPDKYKGWKVPEILLSGNHAEIEKWRKKSSKKS